MPSNLNLVPILVNLSLQEFIVATVNIPPTINVLAFANLMGEFFQVLELEFLVKSSEFFLQLTTFFRQKDETFKMLYERLLKLKEYTYSITDLEVAH
jgi:hypothetical protein